MSSFCQPADFCRLVEWIDAQCSARRCSSGDACGCDGPRHCPSPRHFPSQHAATRWQNLTNMRLECTEPVAPRRRASPPVTLWQELANPMLGMSSSATRWQSRPGYGTTRHHAAIAVPQRGAAARQHMTALAILRQHATLFAILRQNVHLGHGTGSVLPRGGKRDGVARCKRGWATSGPIAAGSQSRTSRQPCRSRRCRRSRRRAGWAGRAWCACRLRADR